MPIPMYDASQALKTNPEKTEEALQKVLKDQQLNYNKFTFEWNYVNNNSEHMNSALYFTKLFSYQFVFCDLDWHNA